MLCVPSALRIPCSERYRRPEWAAKAACFRSCRRHRPCHSRLRHRRLRLGLGAGQIALYKALALAPHVTEVRCWYASHLICTSRFSEAIQQAQKAQMLEHEPSVVVLSHVAKVLHAAGDLDHAFDMLGLPSRSTLASTLKRAMNCLVSCCSIAATPMLRCRTFGKL